MRSVNFHFLIRMLFLHGGFRYHILRYWQEKHMPGKQVYLPVLCNFCNANFGPIQLLQNSVQASNIDKGNCTYPPHDGNRFQWQKSRIPDFIIYNRVKNFFLIITWERRLKRSREKSIFIVQCEKCEEVKNYAFFFLHAAVSHFYPFPWCVISTSQHSNKLVKVEITYSKNAERKKKLSTVYNIKGSNITANK